MRLITLIKLRLKEEKRKRSRAPGFVFLSWGGSAATRPGVGSSGSARSVAREVTRQRKTETTRALIFVVSVLSLPYFWRSPVRIPVKIKTDFMRNSLHSFFFVFRVLVIVRIFSAKQKCLRRKSNWREQRLVRFQVNVSLGFQAVLDRRTR